MSAFLSAFDGLKHTKKKRLKLGRKCGQFLIVETVPSAPMYVSEVLKPSIPNGVCVRWAFHPTHPQCIRRCNSPVGWGYWGPPLRKPQTHVGPDGAVHRSKLTTTHTRAVFGTNVQTRRPFPHSVYRPNTQHLPVQPVAVGGSFILCFAQVGGSIFGLKQSRLPLPVLPAVFTTWRSQGAKWLMTHTNPSLHLHSDQLPSRPGLGSNP